MKSKRSPVIHKTKKQYDADDKKFRAKLQASLREDRTHQGLFPVPVKGLTQEPK